MKTTFLCIWNSSLFDRLRKFILESTNVGRVRSSHTQYDRGSAASVALQFQSMEVISYVNIIIIVRYIVFRLEFRRETRYFFNRWQFWWHFLEMESGNLRERALARGDVVGGKNELRVIWWRILVQVFVFVVWISFSWSWTLALTSSEIQKVHIHRTNQARVA